MREAKAKGDKLVEDYLNAFSGLKKWLEDTKKFARENGYVKSLFGFYRRLPMIHASNHTFRAGAERQAINAPIQGSGSTCTLLAIVDIQNELKKRNLKSCLVATVHDSLVVDCYIPELAEVSKIVIEGMENAHKHRIDTPIPVAADMELGESYGKVFECSLEEASAIHTRADFQHWVHGQYVKKYSKEVDTLKKDGLSQDEIKEWLISHKRNEQDYPEVFEYLNKVFVK